MTHWMCINCGYYLQATEPPQKCPSCKQVCAFNDVTCYRPDCGGESNVDPILVGNTLKLLKVEPASAPKPKVEAGDGLPAVQFFSGLNGEEKGKVVALGRSKSFERDATICAEGEESKSLYVIEEGQAAVESAFGRAMRVPIVILSAGDAFGWSTLVPPYRLTATVVSITRVKVLVIDREKLFGLMHSDPQLGVKIMQNISGAIARRLRNLEQEMVGLVQGKP